MKTTAKETLRAANIIWSAAEDYTINSSFLAFDEKGRAELYWNCIIGLAHKYHNYEKLQDYFTLLSQEVDSDFYVELTWMGLESNIYRKARLNRPALDDLRLNDARNVIQRLGKVDAKDLSGRLHLAKLKSILGEGLTLEEPLNGLLNKLQFDEQLTTEEFISAMDQILLEYFQIKRADRKENQIAKHFNRNKLLHFGQRSIKMKGMPYIKRVSIGSAEKIMETPTGGAVDLKDRITLQWLNFKQGLETNERRDIEASFGVSILSQTETSQLEQAICQDLHKACHIHMTDGTFKPHQPGDIQSELALKQREKNQAYHLEHLVRINASIARLTHKIKNTMLVDFQSAPIKANTGKLSAGKLWRNTCFNDNNVFTKSIYDELGDLSVDILLDASASQINRQEIIAAQGFIIAEALTQCNIPVKVYSYCTRRSFTVFNLFRDYSQTKQNHQIFNYYATGFNRDGLALKTALHMMEKTSYEKRILIVLSDGKPNDMAKISASGPRISAQDYSATRAVEDTAKEARAGRQKGLAILCVFTGRDKDLPAAKKIYGRSLTHIQSPERFSDMVGILIQNELTNQL